MRYLALLVLLFTAPLSVAQPLAFNAELIPSQLGDIAAFGTAVATDGDLALASAANDNVVVAFSRTADGWAQEAVIAAAALDTGDLFGQFVEFDGQRLLVSARGDDSDAGENTGAVYVFERSEGGWVETAKLTASDAEAGDFFGESVDLDGDQAITATLVGGAAYVFTHTGSGWAEEAILVPDDPEDAPFFGAAVAIEGNLALVGSPRFGDTPQVGAIYAFTRGADGWSQTAKLSVASDENPDQIGYNFDYQDGTLVAIGFGAGASSYVFAYDGAMWTLEAEIPLPEGGPAFFTTIGPFDPVSLDGDDVLIGATSFDGGGAYLFSRSNGAWTLEATIESPFEEELVSFGQAVHLNESQAVIGAFRADAFRGRAFVYGSRPVGTADDPETTPRLSAVVYPNPAYQRAHVTFEAARPSVVHLEVYDLLGRQLVTATERVPAGAHTLDVDADDLAAGLYVLRLRVGDEATATTLQVLR
ncbi:MAG: T9SS type A sorting domain-containing protein [Bacteroidota bacterium]